MKTNNIQPMGGEEFERIIAERLAALPPDVKRAISDSRLDGQLLEVAQKNHLRVDESKVLENEVMLALLGVEPLSDFNSNFERHANLSPESAATVSDDVNRLIFAPIRESLKKLWDEENREQPTDAERESAENAPAPEKSKERPLGFAPSPQTAPRAAGIDRTMPRDIMQAKLKGTVHTKTQTHTISPERDAGEAALQQDPYREPLE